MTREDFLSLLHGVKRSGDHATAKCPAHDDKTPSLSVDEGTDGRVLLKCHAGCEAEAIVSAVGKTMADLMPEKNRTRPEEIGWYDYRGENGKVRFQVVRYDPKDFRQRRPDSAGGWIWNTKGVKPCVYRLPELLAHPKQGLVFVCEGEKDADLMASLGYCATTNPGGAGMGWKDAYSEVFEGRMVCILEDNDDGGRAHAKKTKASLERYRASRVEILSLPGLSKGGDVFDWFMKSGSTKAQFDELIRVRFTHDELDREIEKEQFGEDAQELHERRVWSPEDLVKNRAIQEPEGFLYGELLSRGTVSLIMGASSSGKSYFVMFLGSQIALGRDVHGMPTRPGRVLFLSEEMGLADLKYRSALVWDEETRRDLSPNRFNMIEHSDFDFSGKTLRENKSVNQFVKICREANQPDVVFIDSLSRIHTGEENSNHDMLIVMRNLDIAARLANCAVIVIHHFGKPNEFRQGASRGRGASAIVDASSDAISVDCISPEKKESLVTFHKTRALVGKPIPQPFVFTQENDPNGRIVEKADGSKVPAVIFATVVHEPRETKADRETKAARECFERFVGRDPRPEGVNDLGEVGRPEAVEVFKLAFGWGEKKANLMVSRCLAQGALEQRREGKFTIVFLPRN
jgi:hypothetical protein